MDIIDCDIWNVFDLIHYTVENYKISNRIVLSYSNLQIKPARISPGEDVIISLDVKNIGRYNGDEVVQLYIHDEVATVVRPVKELKGFRRISLGPDKKKTIKFTLAPENLAFYDKNMNLIVEAGTYEVMIGSSSEDIRLKGNFEVTGNEITNL